MKNITQWAALFILVLACPALAGQGEPGSQVDSQQANIVSFDLKKIDGTYITIYSGTEFIEMVGQAGGKFAGSLLATMPEDGTYVGYRFSAGDIKMKVKIVWGGVPYYTVAQSVTQGTSQIWQFSTDPAQYGQVSYHFTMVSSIEGVFPKPLVITGTTDYNLVMVNERSGTVDFDGTNISDVTYANEGSLSTGLLTDIPAKKVQFTLTTTLAANPDRTNIVTIFYDAQGAFLGSTCGDAGNWAINARDLINGSVTNIAAGGDGGDFSLTYRDGDQRGSFTVTGNYTCAGGYSGLAVTQTGNPAGYEGSGYILTTSGPVTCATLP